MQYLLHLEGIAASSRLGQVSSGCCKVALNDIACCHADNIQYNSCLLGCTPALQLLHINSLVLRAEESKLVEYFYR